MNIFLKWFSLISPLATKKNPKIVYKWSKRQYGQQNFISYSCQSIATAYVRGSNHGPTHLPADGYTTTPAHLLGDTVGCGIPHGCNALQDFHCPFRLRMLLQSPNWVCPLQIFILKSLKRMPKGTGNGYRDHSPPQKKKTSYSFLPKLLQLQQTCSSHQILW